MFCSKCGKSIKESFEFCIGCGAKVERVTEDENNIETQEINFTEHSVTIPQKRIKRKHIIIASVILILAIVGLVVQQSIATKKYNEIYDDMTYLMFWGDTEMTFLISDLYLYKFSGDIEHAMDSVSRNDEITKINDIVDEQVSIIKKSPVIFKKDLDIFLKLYKSYKECTDLEKDSSSILDSGKEFLNIYNEIKEKRPSEGKLPKQEDLLKKYNKEKK